MEAISANYIPLDLRHAYSETPAQGAVRFNNTKVVNG